MTTRREAVQPTLGLLGAVLPAYGARFDLSLGRAREAIGSSCDPCDPSDATSLRVWLNAWICRIRVPRPGEPDPFLDELCDWWISARQLLPPEGLTLAHLSDLQLDSIGEAYASLDGRTAAVDKRGTVRTFGPTATAKILYFVRPDAVTAWDKAISGHVGGPSAPHFKDHLHICRTWARDLVAEAAALGIAEADIGRSLAQPRPLSSVAKLIDEWLYTTITGGAQP